MWPSTLQPFPRRWSLENMTDARSQPAADGWLRHLPYYITYKGLDSSVEKKAHPGRSQSIGVKVVEWSRWTWTKVPSSSLLTHNHVPSIRCPLFPTHPTDSPSDDRSLNWSRTTYRMQQVSCKANVVQHCMELHFHHHYLYVDIHSPECPTCGEMEGTMATARDDVLDCHCTWACIGLGG